VQNGGRQGAENGLDQFLDAGVAPHDAMHVEEVENHQRKDSIPGDEGGIRFQVDGRDGRIITVKAEPEGKEVGDVDNGEVVDRGEERD